MVFRNVEYRKREPAGWESVREPNTPGCPAGSTLLRLSRVFIDAGLPAIVFLAMLAVGLDLSRAEFRPVIRRPLLIALGALAPNVLLPLISLALIRALRIGPETAGGMLLIAVSPRRHCATSTSTWRAPGGPR